MPSNIFSALSKSKTHKVVKNNEYLPILISTLIASIVKFFKIKSSLILIEK